jgi:hypothetical protein
MDYNIYATEKIAAARLADLRAARVRAALAESSRGSRRGLGRLLGAVLIRVGRRLTEGGAVTAANAGVRGAR